jgi:hypothetical protein
MPPANTCSSKRQSRILCVPFTAASYAKVVEDARQFRKALNQPIQHFPELFPPAIEQGYRMKDSFVSARLGLRIRRIEVAGVSYTVRPSFVMPYLTERAEEVQGPLFLRKFAVPFWALAYVFGRTPMYGYRLEQSLGRYPLVGTTIRWAQDLPQDLVADEKHTWIQGEKVFVATTCGEGCVLGVSVAENAGEVALTRAYGVFKEEVRQVRPSYSPRTVNTDGWPATQQAWRTLFSGVRLIGCFLHVYLGLRERSRKKFKGFFTALAYGAVITPPRRPRSPSVCVVCTSGRSRSRTSRCSCARKSQNCAPTPLRSRLLMTFPGPTAPVISWTGSGNAWTGLCSILNTSTEACSPRNPRFAPGL